MKSIAHPGTDPNGTVTTLEDFQPNCRFVEGPPVTRTIPLSSTVPSLVNNDAEPAFYMPAWGPESQSIHLFTLLQMLCLQDAAGESGIAAFRLSPVSSLMAFGVTIWILRLLLEYRRLRLPEACAVCTMKRPDPYYDVCRQVGLFVRSK